jgi:hypothetical protein
MVDAIHPTSWLNHGAARRLKPGTGDIRNFPVGHHVPCRAVVDAGLSASQLFLGRPRLM